MAYSPRIERFADLELEPVERWRTWWCARAVPTGDSLGDLARRQGFVVSTEQLRAHGWALHDLRRGVRRGEWWVPLRATASPVVIDDGADSADGFVVRRRRHALHATATLLRHPDHLIGGRSAAILRGLPTVSVPRLPELTAREKDDTLGRRTSAHVHGARVTTADVCDWFGAPVLSASRTLVDLGRHDRKDAIMAVDAALRARLVDAASLRRSLAQAIGWPGVRQAREVLGLADQRAESPLESITRLALHDHDFPPPELQFWIGPDRVDFCWPEHRFVLEADGRGKYTDDALWEEKRRETRLRSLGFRAERVTWQDVMSDWPVTSRRLRRALLAR